VSSKGALLVVGCGLIGSSLARAAKRFGAMDRVLVADRDPQVRDFVESSGVADAVAPDLEALAPEADVIAICTPPGAIVEAAAAALATSGEETAVFDVGSVKTPVAEGVAAKAGAAARRFVPAHPIAGTEQSGPKAGFASLFEDRWCLLTPLEDADRDAVARVEAFWRACYARVAVMSPTEHDQLLAATSHAPHLVAYALTATAQSDDGLVNEAMANYSAGGFRDFTRIAASDPVMWRDVFMQNAAATLVALDKFEQRLARLRKAVEAGDAAGLEALFASTRAVRAAIVASGQETAAPDFGRPHPDEE
jgi:cyclohexadieny/prephenate dehydrogenase